MEFPIVFVDSLGKFPTKQSNKLLEEIEDKYFQRPTFEPRDQTKFFDFWRLYYTAFSRAQDLLILTCDEKSGKGKTPSKYFSSVFETLTDAEDKNFAAWIKQKADDHKNLQKTTNYAYVGLMYQMFAFEPFASILDIDIDNGVTDVRPTRNLAMLTQIIGKFEYLHKVDIFNEKFIDRDTEKFFNLYLKLLFDGGISEYEDDSEYAPSGCGSFLIKLMPTKIKIIGRKLNMLKLMSVL